MLLVSKWNSQVHLTGTTTRLFQVQSSKNKPIENGGILTSQDLLKGPKSNVSKKERWIVSHNRFRIAMITRGPRAIDWTAENTGAGPAVNPKLEHTRSTKEQILAWQSAKDQGCVNPVLQ